MPCSISKLFEPTCICVDHRNLSADQCVHWGNKSVCSLVKIICFYVPTESPENVSVCPTDDKPSLYRFTHTNTSHRVNMKWSERDCNTVCQTCKIHIHATNQSHIVMEFFNVNLFLLQDTKRTIKRFS